jgi:zinc transport system substrate-binding protein
MIVMKSRLGLLVTVALLAPLALAGCSALGADSGADNGKTTVVASFYPLQYVAQRIGGDHVTVKTLTHPGAEPHDLELTVPQTAEVADADVVFYERGLQASVDDAVDQTSPKHVVDAAQASPPDGDNPHIWIDPVRMTAIVKAFTDEIVKVDPAHAADYRKRSTGFQVQLAQLDSAYKTGLAHCQITTAVVSHDAFGYLSKYGLSFAFINGLSPDAEPSPEHVRELQDLIQKDGITTVFSETLASPKLADTLAHDLGIKTAVLDPIEGLSNATANQNYVSLMKQNLTSLEKAQECT